MTTPYTRIDAGALSVSGLQRLLDRLPAESRAQIKWSPSEIRSALATFLDSPRDETALNDLVAVLAKQSQAISSAFVSLVAHPELLRSELEEAWRADAAVLRDHIEPAATEAADWVMRAWVAFMDLSFSIMRSLDSEFPSSPISDHEAIYQPGSPLRSQALMMAAIESARQDGNPGAISDLVFRAFDEVVLMLQELRRRGFQLDPYRGETLGERARRLHRYADHLRSALTDVDMRELELSRLRSLR